jgi:uncharacterized membrane protein
MKPNAIATSFVLLGIALLVQASVGQSTTYPGHLYNGTYNGVAYGFRAGSGLNLLVPILIIIIIILLVIIAFLVYKLRKKGHKGRK